MLSFVPVYIPNLLQALPFVLVFALACAKPLRKHPLPFYLLFTAACVLVTWAKFFAYAGGGIGVAAQACSAWLSALPSTAPALDAVIQILSSSYTGVAIYLVVMFIGALRPRPWVRRLKSIRSELSMIGGIIIFAHTLRVFPLAIMFGTPVAATVWGAEAYLPMLIASAIIGPLLTLCFLPLWITTFKGVLRRMEPKAWKKLQKLAYPFMGLMVGQGFFLALGHGLYYLGSLSSAVTGGTQSAWVAAFAGQVATAWLYLFIGVAYVVLRVLKYRDDRARRAEVTASALSPEGRAERSGEQPMAAAEVGASS